MQLPAEVPIYGETIPVNPHTEHGDNGKLPDATSIMVTAADRSAANSCMSFKSISAKS
jgi:hypothetical protein